MILISHRGNLNGPSPLLENAPMFIQQALDAGYDCEIDVWKIDEGFFLGHDEPTHKIDPAFLLKAGLWCHAKNIESLAYLSSQGIHCFWHQEDDVTLTSRGFIWTHVKMSESKYLIPTHSIAVMPEWNNNRDFVQDCMGVCSDYIETY